MGKYDALGEYLRKQAVAEIPMTFAQIERLIGVPLPPKAQKHRAWWSNNPSNSMMTKAWLDAGFRSEQVDMEGRKLVFRRSNGSPLGPRGTKAYRKAAGLPETARSFEPEGGMNKPYQPAFGALKGTFTIAPGRDLTSPMYSGEEWAEVEKEMEVDWDEIERGMRGQR
jgi:hypothetical protein